MGSTTSKVSPVSDLPQTTQDAGILDPPSATRIASNDYQSTPVMTAENPPPLQSGANPHAAGAKAPGNSTSNPPSCKCYKSPNSRNLVVCIDGTANQFGVKVCILGHDYRDLLLSVSKRRIPMLLNCTAALRKATGNSRTMTVGLGLMSKNLLRFAIYGK
jgi:hypothetical protein